MQSTIRNGRRWSAADAYLRPALRRPNLKVEVQALATRLLFNRMKCSGVEYVKDGAEAERCTPSARCCSAAASSTRRSS